MIKNNPHKDERRKKCMCLMTTGWRIWAEERCLLFLFNFNGIHNGGENVYEGTYWTETGGGMHGIRSMNRALRNEL
jgi:hypothetical protein